MHRVLRFCCGFKSGSQSEREGTARLPSSTCSWPDVYSPDVQESWSQHSSLHVPVCVCACVCTHACVCVREEGAASSIRLGGPMAALCLPINWGFPEGQGSTASLLCSYLQRGLNWLRAGPQALRPPPTRLPWPSPFSVCPLSLPPSLQRTCTTSRLPLKSC